MSNKVTAFRRPSSLKAETPNDCRIVFEVGADWFAIDYAITGLNQKPAQVIPILKTVIAKSLRRRTRTIMTT